MVLEDSDMELVFEIEVAVSRNIHVAFGSFLLRFSLAVFIVLVVSKE